jgi:hypothetical protein
MHHSSTAAWRAGLRPVLLAVALAACGSILPLSSLGALEEGADEGKVIDACDKRLCRMLQQKNPKGDDLKCSLTKTWAQSTLKEADQRDVKWSFGDARCSVNIDMSRAAIIAAVSGGDAKLWVPPHTANCIIEQDGQASRVTATLAPKIVFKDGKAEKIWINLLNIEGPVAIRATLTTAARLADSIGLFHRAMLKSVNGYIYKHCPKYHPLVEPVSQAPAKPARPKTAKATKSSDPASSAAEKK